MEHRERRKWCKEISKINQKTANSYSNATNSIIDAAL